MRVIGVADARKHEGWWAWCRRVSLAAFIAALALYLTALAFPGLRLWKMLGILLTLPATMFVVLSGMLVLTGAADAARWGPLRTWRTVTTVLVFATWLVTAAARYSGFRGLALLQQTDDLCTAMFWCWLAFLGVPIHKAQAEVTSDAPTVKPDPIVTQARAFFQQSRVAFALASVALVPILRFVEARSAPVAIAPTLILLVITMLFACGGLLIGVALIRSAQ